MSCYGQSRHNINHYIAERVLMAELIAGDRVLTSTATGSLTVTRVLINQHAKEHDATPSRLLTLHTSSATIISLTPDHALYIDGVLAAAADAKVGSRLTSARGDVVVVTRVDHQIGAVINPTTVAATILASDGGTPILAASHPIWIAPLLIASPAAAALANAALYVVGDQVNLAGFVIVLLIKVAATLLIGHLINKAVRYLKGTSEIRR